MLRMALSLVVVAAVPLAMAACAGPNVAVVDWGRPFKPMTGPAPVFLHQVAIVNAPYPRDAYPHYEDEPTRFIFRPRNVIDEEVDDGTGGVDPAGDGGDYDLGGDEEQG
jgi:hypothetical protein